MPVRKGFKTLCVTGANGFIGQHLMASDSSPHDTVYHLLSRRKDDCNVNPSHCRIFSGDLKTPYIEEGFVVPDATVVNLAYLKGDKIDENITAVDHLLEQCIMKRARLMIHCSTAVVAGAVIETKVDEHTACRPVTQYERCKLAIERHLIDRCRDRMNLAIVRPTVVFGKGGGNLNSIIDFVARSKAWKKMLRISIFDTRKMNLISAENVAASIHHVASIESSAGCRLYIISDDDQPLNTFGGVVRLISDTIGCSVPPIIPLPFKSFFQKVILRTTHGISVVPDRRYSGRKLAEEGFDMPFAFEASVRKYVQSRYRSKWKDK